MIQLLYTVLLLSGICGHATNEQVRKYLQGFNTRAEQMYNKKTIASWSYYTNITAYNQQDMTNRSLEFSEFLKEEVKTATKFNIDQVTDELLKRQLEKVLDIGINGYENTDVLRKISDIRADLTGIYSSARWCPTTEDCKMMEPDLTDLMANSRDYEELKAAWKGWRDVSGAKMRDQYEEFVRLTNEAIKAGGKYEDMGAYYRSWYEQPSFQYDMGILFKKLKPLYENLHAYVRRKLREHYGEEHFPSTGHIPAHLFGNMWAQNWENIYDLLVPFPDQGQVNLTRKMEEQGYTVKRMYKVAEVFFTSIGMPPMPLSFWENSMLEKPKDDRDVVCHASAWDFGNLTDFRIKQCTTVTWEQFYVVQHEMGHIQYYLGYQDLPFLFREGANPGFHEGVADIATLSFKTPENLKKLGLIDFLPTNNKADINFLLKMALKSVAFLPFGYLIDQWRWSVYRGDTRSVAYNTHWWNARCRFQGIYPPVERSEDDFDPGAKYHVAANTPYIRYFVSFVAQFQWHKSLCELIGQQEPLHRCNIYQNKTAGTRLQEMLRMGSSRPWGEAMQKITRGTSGETDKLDAQAMLDYFKPLMDWLTDINKQYDEPVGWDEQCPAGSFKADASHTRMSIMMLIFAASLHVIC